MNREDVLSQLAALFREFWCHPDLCSDLVKIISKSGYETKFFNILVIRLRYLIRNGKNSVNHQEWFEELKYSNNLYSMRLTGRGFNVRILYAFSKDNQPMLLLGFEEKSGKRSTDYTNFIPEAEERLHNETGGN